MLIEKELLIDIMIAYRNLMLFSAMSEVLEDDDRFSLVATSAHQKTFWRLFCA